MALRGRAKVFGGEWVVRSAKNAWRSLRVCVGAAGTWQEGRGRARRCAGAGEDLRRGMGCGVGGRASSRGGGAEVCGEGVRKCSGRAKIFGGECCEVGGRASSLRGEWKCAGRG